MKVRALRLMNVGTFSAPTALEGLSGGLDVVVGPNEMGKSTLFGALSHLLGTPATSKGREITALRSDDAGGPVIEADIEIATRLLRFRKRFLSRPAAQLTDLRSGETWHDAEAEKTAERLLGGDGRSAARGLLWVAQGAGFTLPDKPDASLSSALAALIEQEAADAAGAAEARRVAEQVRQRLDELVTLKTGRARANGPLDAARKRRDALTEQLDLARARAAAAQSRIAQHMVLTAERARVVHPDLIHGLVAETDAARAAVDAAERARHKLQSAAEQLKSARLAREQATGALQRFDAAAGQMARLKHELADALERRASLEARHVALEAALRSSRDAAAAREAQIAVARADLEKARRHGAFKTAQAELARLDADQKAALDATTAEHTAAGALAVIRVTQASLDELQSLVARLAVAEARVAAEAPTATLRCLPGAHARVRIGGKEMPAGEPLLIERATEIEIEGVGTILIAPPQPDGISPAVQRDDMRRAMRAALDAVGVDGIEAAGAALERRRGLEADRTRAAAHLAAVAPNGIEALEARRAEAADRLRELDEGDGSIDAADAERRLRELSDALAACRGPLLDAEKELGTTSHALTRASALIDGIEGQLASAAAETPDPAVAAECRARLAAEAEAAHAALADATREYSAWREAAPSPEAFDALTLQARRAAEALGANRARRDAIDRELASLEGALRRDGEDGAGSDVPGLEEELTQAEARVADLEIDAAALTMLASRLEQARSDHRERVLRPVVSRLDALLGRLFPEARLAMEGPLLAVRLDRGARSDAHVRLSGGTREQIAILVRLAYADLMAARGIELPLVLDDALVYSDDQRLAIMVELLADASARHQVIMLSCHERAVAPLLAAYGARPLELTPWDAEAPATIAQQKGRTRGPASAILV